MAEVDLSKRSSHPMTYMSSTQRQCDGVILWNLKKHLPGGKGTPLVLLEPNNFSSSEDSTDASG